MTITKCPRVLVAIKLVATTQWKFHKIYHYDVKLAWLQWWSNYPEFVDFGGTTECMRKFRTDKYLNVCIQWWWQDSWKWETMKDYFKTHYPSPNYELLFINA